MIRFRCPNCAREYLLADALAHLPLICKGCGQRLTVPDPEPEPPPAELPPPPPPEPKKLVPPPPAVAVPAPATPAPPRDRRKFLAGVVDGVVALVVLAAGVFVGEVVAQKPTGEILSGAGAAPFPPTNLLLWLGCVAASGLVYVWLWTRGWTVGGWLKRQADD